ncbi:MAG: GDP-mannose 4,6-dehydratase [Planctomycetes bacterium]|nr:GDP-mannose 4,6-dehydratase [Planctomycetota bacterium]
MEILVTGGAGFIGSHLTERLLGRGDSVVVFDNFNDFYDPALKEHNVASIQAAAQRPGSGTFALVRGDLRERAALESCVRSRPFDAVVHLAAMAGVRPSVKDPVLYDQVNCIGTLHLLEAMRARPEIRLIFGSSSSVYGANTKVPFAETDPLERMVSPYAVSKRSGELYAACFHQLYGIPITCLRFFTVYGPRQRPEMAIAKFAALIEQGKDLPIYGDGSTRRDYTYVDDILDGIVRAIDRCSGFEIYNLGESSTVELRRLVDVLAQAIGKPAHVKHLPPEPGDVPLTYADVSKARTQLGYEPRTTIEDGVARYVEWRRRLSSR